MPPFAVILPAGGRSQRFGGGKNKLLENLAGQSVLSRSIAAFADRADVPLILIPTPPGFDLPASQKVPNVQKVQFCPGGPSRAHSVLNALRLVPQSIEWLAIHDAARPLISQDLVDRTLAAAVEHGAAVPALPVSLTIKQASGPLPARVQRTLPRHELWAMQTPQIMRRQALLRAFETCPVPLDQITDDAQLLELAGQEVWLIPGEDRNLKITTAQDLKIAELLLIAEVSPVPSPRPRTRGRSERN